MTLAVRALSVFLTVWLTTATAFPPCCWSMGHAHTHQEQQKATEGPVQSHDHHHHDATDSAAPAETATMMFAVPAPYCDAESSGVVATVKSAVSRIDMQAATATAADLSAPLVAVLIPLTDIAPAASPGSAFLNPLRI